MGAERNFDLRLRMDGERRGPFRDTISRGIGGTLPLTHASRPSFNRVLEKKREGGRSEAKEKGKDMKRQAEADISAIPGEN